MLGKLIKMPIVKYIFCSCFTMGIETVLGLLLLQVFGLDAVVANTIAVIIGGSIHYYLISKGVFESDINTKNTFSYVFTFFVGMLLQNVVLYVCYSILLTALVETLRYIISKGVSVVVPFTATYLLRKYLLKKK